MKWGYKLLGIVGTFLYLGLLVWFRWADLSELEAMALNELGDFLAGVFAPLAFWWLVLGYFQQGEELRLQAIELRNSVDQHRELVQATEAQTALEKTKFKEAFRAEITFSGMGETDHQKGGDSNFPFYFRVRKNPAHKLSFETTPSVRAMIEDYSICVEPGREFAVTCCFKDEEEFPSHLSIKLSYQSLAGEDYWSEFCFEWGLISGFHLASQRIDNQSYSHHPGSNGIARHG